MPSIPFAISLALALAPFSLALAVRMVWLGRNLVGQVWLQRSRAPPVFVAMTPTVPTLHVICRAIFPRLSKT